MLAEGIVARDVARMIPGVQNNMGCCGYQSIYVGAALSFHFCPCIVYRGNGFLFWLEILA